MLRSRHSLFPLAVISLSLVLAGFMYWTLQDEQPAQTQTQQEVAEEPVDAEAYVQDMQRIITTFEERMEAGDDLEQLLATETALAGVLSVRVPVEFKEAHLDLAVALSQLQAALKSEGRDTAEAQAAVMQVMNDMNL